MVTDFIEFLIAQEHLYSEQLFSRVGSPDILREILGGEATASPAKLGEEVACTWCPVKEACVRDMRLPGPPEREMPTLKTEEVWKKLWESEMDGERKEASEVKQEGGA